LDEKVPTFSELGVCSEICEAVQKMGYKQPTKIQCESLPYTLKDRDIIGLAETGSGKTASFAIPII
jgi:ATP-dependent RNA helicase DDX47/RRP3